MYYKPLHSHYFIAILTIFFLQHYSSKKSLKPSTRVNTCSWKHAITCSTVIKKLSWRMYGISIRLKSSFIKEICPWLSGVFLRSYSAFFEKLPWPMEKIFDLILCVLSTLDSHFGRIDKNELSERYWTKVTLRVQNYIAILNIMLMFFDNFCGVCFFF